MADATFDGLLELVLVFTDRDQVEPDLRGARGQGLDIALQGFLVVGQVADAGVNLLGKLGLSFARRPFVWSAWRVGRCRL